MKIALHCYNYKSRTDSIGLNVHRYVNKLVEKGHVVHIITQLEEGQCEHEITENGVVITRIPRYKVPILSTYVYMQKVVKVIANIKPDVVHEHEAFGAGYFAKKNYGIPYIVYGRGIDVYNYTKWTKKVIKNANAVIALSNDMSKFINENIKPIGNVFVIRNGITKDEYAISKNNNPKKLLYVGRLIPKKNVDKIIYAMQYVLDYHPDAVLNIVGEGYEMHRLRDIIMEYHLEHKVILRGKMTREETKRMYEKSGIFIMPTEHTEGCNNTIIEAMLSGCVVLASGNYANDELIDNMNNGIMLDNNDPETIGNNIRYVFDKYDRPKIQNFKKENQKRLNKLDKYGLDLDANVDSMITVYKLTQGDIDDIN